MAINFTTPVGRIVQGELSKAQPVLDDNGTQKLTRDGLPAIQHFIALAIPKVPGHTHWAQTDWGKQVWDEGNRAHPTFAPHPSFSWKIEDGDSTAPNKVGKKNADREGFPGSWILRFRSSFLPKTYNADGSAPIPAENFKCGYYAQVNCTVTGNTGKSPGVYLNPNMVALSGYGEEIIAGPDAKEAGFGAAPLPPGASATPLGGFVAPAVTPPVPAPAGPYWGTVPAFTATGVAPAAPFAAPFAAAGTAVPPSFPQITPPASASTATTSPSNGLPSNGPAPVNPAFLAPPAPPVAPPASAKRMTAAANGASYADMIRAGWNDALLVQHGMMEP